MRLFLVYYADKTGEAGRAFDYSVCVRALKNRKKEEITRLKFGLF
jgi:hypothetical protein